MKRHSRHLLALVGTVAITLACSIPAHAGPKEAALLSSYVGDWRGSSMLAGGTRPEAFSCRLRIAKGNQAKINYTGRCTSAGNNVSLSGTISYDDASHSYKAAMSSSAGYQGTATGRVRGDAITFDLAGRQSDRSGNVADVQTRITLAGSRSIVLDYRVKLSDSPKVLTASVPFRK